MDGRPGLVALRVVCGQVGTNRAIVIETKSEARREPIRESDGVHRVQSGGDELAAARRGLAECRLNRLTGTIGVADNPTLKRRPSGVPAVLDLGPDLHLVIRSEKRPVVA